MSKTGILGTAAYRRGEMFPAHYFFLKFLLGYYMSSKYLSLPFSFTNKYQSNLDPDKSCTHIHVREIKYDA